MVIVPTSPVLRSGGEPAWARGSGGVSDTSSSEDEIETTIFPQVPIVPSLMNDSDMLATWDLLSRPGGCSLRQLRRAFRRKHGQESRWWLTNVLHSSYFETFYPHKRPLAAPAGKRDEHDWGQIYVDGRKHPNAVVVPCYRPQALGNPWPVNPEQSLERVCELCADLMVYGGSPSSYGGLIHAHYRSADADVQRDAALQYCEMVLRGGGDIHLRCCRACEARRRADPQAACHVHGIKLALFTRLRAARAVSYASSAARPRSDVRVVNAIAERSAVDRHSRRLHVRRAPPVPPMGFVPPPRADARLAAAVAQSAALQRQPAPRIAVERVQPLAFAGVTEVPYIPDADAAAPFSHRRAEPMPDGECILLPFPATNVPPVVPVEIEPPADPDSSLVAYSVAEVVPHNLLLSFRSWRRRAVRAEMLMPRGKSARRAKPPDLKLPARSRGAFRGVVMDFTSYPFRPVMPSRWPERPPSTDLSIRQFRREFRFHWDYVDRQLRSLVSHGYQPVVECSRDWCHFAAPHNSAFEHWEPWRKQMDAEFRSGWGRRPHERAEGLISWPSRCQPTSMVQRHGKWRLCHDMSWPPLGEDADVESPNDADWCVMVIVFISLGQFCLVVLIFRISGAPVKLWKFDLSKFYKRSGQQSANVWHRTCWSSAGEQSLDRVCFGQRDGPSGCSRQSTWLLFIIRREVAFADASYPTRDPRVLAYLRERERFARAAGDAASAASRRAGVDPWRDLMSAVCFIDDVGAVSFDDLLWRLDGSLVCNPDGSQRTRAWLHFEAAQSVVLRVGHLLEPSDPDKFWPPSDSMVLIGGAIDVQAETLSLESDGPSSKRARYLRELRDLRSAGSATHARWQSAAFKLLVVCEVASYYRQHLHPIFQMLRGDSGTQRLHITPEVDAALAAFESLLSGEAPISVPLASRCTFPYADVADLLVIGYDAAGKSAPAFVAEPDSEDGTPGFGAWTVRGRRLLFLEGPWTADELDALSITVLEALALFWGEVAFSQSVDGASHILGFTDNTGAEWAARRETPHAILMQKVSARRAAYLHEHSIFSRTYRVPSLQNSWADDLSRGRVAKVLAEAVSLGLSPLRVHLHDLRDTAWLCARA